MQYIVHSEYVKFTLNLPDLQFTRPGSLDYRADSSARNCWKSLYLPAFVATISVPTHAREAAQ